jgi:hypothetical protein
MAVRREAAFLAHRIATPRHRFIPAKAFSAGRWRQMCSLHLRYSFPLDLGGITGAIPSSAVITH